MKAHVDDKLDSKHQSKNARISLYVSNKDRLKVKTYVVILHNVGNKHNATSIRQTLKPKRPKIQLNTYAEK